jgi:hypothetical protein
LKEMSMVEYQTLYYIMYREALEKLKEQEREKQAARDDEIKRQMAYGGSTPAKDRAIFTDEELKKMGVPSTSQPVLEPEDDVVNGTRPPEAYHAKAPSFSESDLEEMMEEEGLL